MDIKKIVSKMQNTESERTSQIDNYTNRKNRDIDNE